MSKVKPDGSSLLKHYQSLAKNKKKGFEKLAEDAEAELAKFNYRPPAQFSDMYDVFWNLRYATPADQFISYTELYSFCKLTQRTLTPAEVELIRDLDASYLTQYNEENTNVS